MEGKIINSIRQILFNLILAAIFAVVIAGVIFVAGDNRYQYLQSDAAKENNESENGVSNQYWQMARFALKEPDAKILMPVKNVRVRQIADTWGAARANGREHQGQDIFARRGTPIFSATEGYVLRIGTSPLGGNTVFILGAGGRRYYYAHLDAFAPDLKAGDFVTAETLIGYVGSTGNAANTPPHLHFGVYETGGAINPLTLIVDRG